MTTTATALRRVLRRTWIVYTGLTLLAFVALWIAGMSPWDAANHAQTAAATGGFSTSADSLGGFGTAAQVVVLVVMLLGAVSFATLRGVTFGLRPKCIVLDPQARWLAGGALLVAAVLLIDGGLPAWRAVFEAVSAVATCGFTVRGDASPGLLGAAAITAAMLVGRLRGFDRRRLQARPAASPAPPGGRPRRRRPPPGRAAEADGATRRRIRGDVPPGHRPALAHRRATAAPGRRL